MHSLIVTILKKEIGIQSLDCWKLTEKPYQAADIICPKAIAIEILLTRDPAELLIGSGHGSFMNFGYAQYTFTSYLTVAIESGVLASVSLILLHLYPWIKD